MAGSWTTVGPVIDGQAGDADGSLNQNVQFMLTALATDTSYDIEVTVTDTDGVDWTTIQADRARRGQPRWPSPPGSTARCCTTPCALPAA